MATASVSPLTRFDDMDDSFEISFCREQVDAGHRRFVPLFTALSIARELIFPDFRAADEEAQKQRKKYQIISQVAVWSGLAAIVIGLFAIVFPNFFPLPSELLEFAAAALCVVFILQGTHSKPKENWLLARYQAENLRLLKFRTLLDSRLWCDDTEQFDQLGETPSDHVRNDVLAAVRSLKGLVYEDVAERASQGVIPDVSEIHCPDSSHQALQEIIHYYREKRLKTQMDYLAYKSGTEERDGSMPHLWMSITFFVSFGFILIHLGLDLGHFLFANPNLLHNSHLLWSEGREALEAHRLITKVLVTIAVLGPAFVAGIKTYRASREFERNALRHRATLHSLEGLNQKMSDAKNMARKFRIARTCELILEFDSSEFMRLLREVEWYG
jgi:hypothetical protein